MQIRDPDSVESSSGMPPAPAPAAPLTGAAYAPVAPSVAALSDDALLLEALLGAAGEGCSVSSSPSSDRFVDQVVANGGGIVLIDAASVTVSLRSFVVMLREQFPQLVLLVAGSAQAQGQIAGQIADGTVFRFVHKPASSQRLRLFLEAAARRHAGASTAELRALVPPENSPAPSGTAGGRQGLIVGGSVLGALAILAIAWAFMHGRTTAPTDSAAAGAGADGNAVMPASTGTAMPAPGPAGAPAPAPAEIPPPSPHDAPAHDAAALAAPGRDAALEAAQRTAQGARAEQLALYLQLARKRISSGALVQPADDNALSYLESARALAPADPEVRATAAAMGEALVGQFRGAIEARDPVQARHWLAACNDLHLPGSHLAQLNAQLAQLEASLQQRSSPADSAQVREVPAASTPQPAPAAAAEPPPALAAAAAPSPAVPAPAVAPSAATAAPEVVSESALKRVSFVAPSYPRAALERNISGWVDLEFTVTPEGSVTDVEVTAAEPHDTFERVAKIAMQSCRYQPVLRNGVAVAQRARMRVRFKP